MRDTRAKERITLARQRHRLPAVAELLTRGELSYGYATTLADAVARLDGDDCAKAETLLLDMVGQGFSPGRVAAVGHRIRDVIAARDGHEHAPDDARRGYERSWITSTRSLDGGRYIRGWLNPEDTAIWDGTLAPLVKPAGQDDHRDLPERTAAALSSVLSGGHKATKVTVICDLDTLTGGHTPARLTDGTPIPAPQARRIALAAGVSPLLLTGGHTPLYLGHKVRFATAAQRQVLEPSTPPARYKGARFPGRCARSTTSTDGPSETAPPTSTNSPCAADGTTATNTPTPTEYTPPEMPPATTPTASSHHPTREQPTHEQSLQRQSLQEQLPREQSPRERSAHDRPVGGGRTNRRHANSRRIPRGRLLASVFLCGSACEGRVPTFSEGGQRSPAGVGLHRPERLSVLGTLCDVVCRAPRGFRTGVRRTRCGRRARRLLLLGERGWCRRVSLVVRASLRPGGRALCHGSSASCRYRSTPAALGAFDQSPRCAAWSRS